MLIWFVKYTLEPCGEIPNVLTESNGTTKILSISINNTNIFREICANLLLKLRSWSHTTKSLFVK